MCFTNGECCQTESVKAVVGVNGVKWNPSYLGYCQDKESFLIREISTFHGLKCIKMHLVKKVTLGHVLISGVSLVLLYA